MTIQHGNACENCDVFAIFSPAGARTRSLVREDGSIQDHTAEGGCATKPTAGGGCATFGSDRGHRPRLLVVVTRRVTNRYTDAGSGCCQGTRYGRRRRRLACSSPITCCFCPSQWIVRPSCIDRFARIALAVEMYPSSMSA